jgi:predicted RNA-binding Zn-ribbon protein involved in translation (DUF1610 family)
MDVTTKCPKCGLLLALDTNAAEEFECPQCGQRLTVQTTAPRAKPVKRAPPRRTASSGAPPASHVDDIDWSIPEIPLQYQKRKKRQSVDLDPAVIWAGAIVAFCVVALIAGGVYFSRDRSGVATFSRDGRTTMAAYAPDDWDVQSFLRIGALQRHAHRNSLILLNAIPAELHRDSVDDFDEAMVSDGVGKTAVVTSTRDLPAIHEFRKRGGTTETYQGQELLRIKGRSVARLNDRAVGVAENDAGLKRMIDASRVSNKSPPNLPNDCTAFFRIRTRAVKQRAQLPDWMIPFDSIGVSVRLNSDGSAAMFLFGEAASEAAATEAIPNIDRVRQNFREQLGAVRTLFKGAISDLEKLASALANNGVVQEGNRVGVRCVVSADLFQSLAQTQFGPAPALPSTPSTPPPVNIPPVVTTPPPKKETDKKGMPAFLGSAADRAEQIQESLSGQFGRKRTVMVVGYGFAKGAEQDQLAGKVTELVKKSHIGNNAVHFSTASDNQWVASVFAPVDDLDGLSRAIEFAMVAQVDAERRRIYLTPKK